MFGFGEEVAEKSEPKKYAIDKISSVTQFKKFTRKGNKLYQINIAGKSYGFFGDGKAAQCENKNGVLKIGKLVDSKTLAAQLLTIEKKQQALEKKKQSAQKNTSKGVEGKANAGVDHRNQSTRDDVLVNKLVQAVLTDPAQINELVDIKSDEYIKLVNSSEFQSRVDYAMTHIDSVTGNIKTKYIVLIQIQARFKYDLGNPIDGIRSKACDDAMNRTQTAKSLSEYRNELTDPFDHLRELVKSKNQSKIEEDLRINADQYRAYVRGPAFEQKLAAAIQNPERNALIIQLYGRFGLGDNSIRIDGIYGAQTKNIVERYGSGPSEKERAERRAAREKGEGDSHTKEQEITTTISTKFIESLSPEDTARYSKLFELPENVLKSLIKEADQRGKTPEQLTALCKKRQDRLSEKAITAASKGCINYLEKLFDIDGGQNLEETILKNFDISKDSNLHDQNIDLKVNIDGKKVSLCYDTVKGEIKYSPSFFLDPKNGNITKGKEGFETSFITAKVPSIASLLEDGKNGVISSSSKNPTNGRESVNTAIKNIETPPKDIVLHQAEAAKNVAKESCMKTFLDLTGYTLPQDMPKNMHENDQLYVMYDIFNRTFNNPNSTADDIKHLKKLLVRIQGIVNTYQDPSKVIFKNMRNDQFSLEKTHKEKTDLLVPKIGTEISKSLSFYTLFSQYINPKLNVTEANYRVVDTKKLEADIDFYDKHTYLSDSIIRGSATFDEEKSEKAKADEFLEKNWA